MIALLVCQPDRELIPWATGVAMAAAEGDRQVLERKTIQLRIPLLLEIRQQLVAFNFLGQRVEQRLMPPIDAAVEQSDVVAEVAPGHQVVIIEDAAPQDVVQNVGIMVF